jgi:predicted TIM-barrel fold metal-dependent hydrolase
MQTLRKICDRAGERPRVIDLHTHTFNALYLPVQGIFWSWCAHFHVPRAIGLAVGVVVELITIARSGVRRLAPTSVREEEIHAEELLRELVEDVPEAALYDDRVQEGLREAGGEAELEALRASRVPHRELVDRAVTRLFERFRDAVPPSIFLEEEDLRGMDEGAVRDAAWRRWLRWIALMTSRDTNIARTLCDVSPGIGLFIHHMMDIENWYRFRSFYSVRPVQLSLVRDLLVGSDGRLVPFVAFDPKRGTGLKEVKAGIELGCAGVKFYPANGYKPSSNGTKIQKAVDALFEWCEAEGVPIFTHCTPSGFEAKIGKSGCNANPELWTPVLKRWPGLRLCFGHAGGHKGWVGETDDKCGKGKKAFAEKVIELCSDPNLQVYCEIGYLSTLFQDGPRDKSRSNCSSGPVLRRR